MKPLCFMASHNGSPVAQILQIDLRSTQWNMRGGPAALAPHLAAPNSAPKNKYVDPRWNFWMSPSFKIRFHQKDRIWVNYNISLTWIKAIWGWFSLLTMIPVRSQWGRYNLPRLDYVAKKFGFHPDFINDGRSWDVFMGHLIFSFVWEYGIPKPSG